MWVLIISGVVLIFMGLAVHKFKWHFLISGYNTMSKEKKANVDVVGVARFIGVYAYICGSVFILAGVLYALGFKFFLSPAIIIFVLMTFYVLIKAQRYDGNVFNKDGKLVKGAGKQFIIPVGVFLVSIIFVVILMYYSSQSTKVTFLDNGVQIHGMYGEVYDWEDIKSVELIDELPTIELRTNGSALGSKLKGYFRTTELGTVKLFVNAKKSPFIYLDTVKGITIFNMENEDEIQEIYMDILSKIE